MSDAAAAVEHACREERAAVLATLIRHVGDFQLAEDAVQDAFAAAVAILAARRRPGATRAPGSRSRRGGRRSTGCGASARSADRVDRLAELARLDAQDARRWTPTTARWRTTACA